MTDPDGPPILPPAMVDEADGVHIRAFVELAVGDPSTARLVVLIYPLPVTVTGEFSKYMAEKANEYLNQIEVTQGVMVTIKNPSPDQDKKH